MRLSLGGHFAGVDALDGLRPGKAEFGFGGVDRGSVEPKLPFLLVLSMTAEAMVAKELGNGTLGRVSGGSWRRFRVVRFRADGQDGRRTSREDENHQGR